jgi:hypothetical protein
VKLGAVWAYILLFILLAPEMSREERAQIAAEAEEFEELRKTGSSLAEIGQARARARYEKSIDEDAISEDKVSDHHEKRAEEIGSA